MAAETEKHSQRSSGGTPETRRRPLQARAKRRVEQMLDATEQVLKEVGYAKASTNRIAKAAGVAVGSVYQYFSGKEALVAAVLERSAQRQFDVLRERAEQPQAETLTAVTRELVQTLAEMYYSQADLYRVILEEVPRGALLEDVHEIDHRAVSLIASYLQQYQAQLVVDDLELAAFVVLHTTEALLHQAANYRPDLFAEDRLVDEATRFVLRYLMGADTT